MLVGARPLHTQGLADSLGKQCGISGDILMTVPAVAASAFDINAAYVFGRQSEHLRELAAQRAGCLRGRP
jgi:hypothetical protein